MDLRTRRPPRRLRSQQASLVSVSPVWVATVVTRDFRATRDGSFLENITKLSGFVDMLLSKIKTITRLEPAGA